MQRPEHPWSAVLVVERVVVWRAGNSGGFTFYGPESEWTTDGPENLARLADFGTMKEFSLIGPDWDLYGPVSSLSRVSPPTSVPEPATFSLRGLGLAGSVFVRRKRAPRRA